MRFADYILYNYYDFLLYIEDWVIIYPTGPGSAGRGNRGIKLDSPVRRDLEIAALRERLSRLSRASLRITGDLEFMMHI